MKQIHQEHFETWLFSQPDERTWDYTSHDSCLLCAYLKEQLGFPYVSVVPGWWTDTILSPNKFPDWLNRFLELERGSWARKDGWYTNMLTAKMAKAGYTKLFNITNKDEPIHTHLPQTTRA